MTHDIDVARLRECPLCGRKGYLADDQRGAFWIECNDIACAASIGARNSPEAAIAAWNTRTPEKALLDTIEGLEGERDAARELARGDGDRRIEIALKILAARFPVVLDMTPDGRAAIINAMEDFAQALDIGQKYRTREALSACIDAEARALAAEQRVAEMGTHLKAMCDLYDSDDGCRSLPQYVAARKALSQRHLYT